MNIDKGFKLNMTIKNRLFISFLAFLILPSSVIGWFSYQKAASQVEAEIQKNATQNVQAVNSQINQLMSASLADMDYLSKTVKSNMVDGLPSPELRKVLDPIKNVKAEYDYVQFATTNGVMLNSPQQKFDAGFDPRTRPWYSLAMQQKGKALLNSPIVGQDGKVIVVPSKATEDGSGVVSAVLSLSNLAKQVNAIKVGQTGFVSIMDTNSKYLTHPSIAPGSDNKDVYAKQLYAQNSGTINYTDNAQNKRMIFVTNEMTGWKVVGTIEMSEITAATRSILYTTMAVIAIAMLIGVALVFFIVRSITSPLTDLKEAMKQIASGNLRSKLTTNRKDEMGQMFNHLNQTGESLKQLIGKISANSETISSSAVQLSASSEQTSKAAEHISLTIQDVAAGSDKQTQSVEEATQIVTEMSRGVQQITSNAKQLSVNAANTSEKSTVGNQAIQNTIQQMSAIQATVDNLAVEVKSLGEQSSKIGDIVQTITDISGQTNLLALNAAIEAARAGEYGRGFAVVADEVRKLAEQSAASADQIAQLISQNRKQTDLAVKTMEATTHEVAAGIDLVNTAGESFREIQNATEDVTHQTEQVAAAIQQLAQSTKMIVKSIDEISTVAVDAATGTQNVSASTQEQLASLQEVSASASSLSQTAEELQSLIKSFKL